MPRMFENGVWKCMGAPITYVSVHGSAQVIHQRKMRDHSRYLGLVTIIQDPQTFIVSSLLHRLPYMHGDKISVSMCT